MPKIFGLTGSISVGKSTVTDYLISKGYLVLDADKLSHEAYYDENCKKQIKEIFNCYDENDILDRKKLGKIVFSDKNKKKQLENIIHPYVLEQMQKTIKESKEKYIFLDIPLLFECGLEYLCDEIIVVYIPEELQIQRLMNRNNISEEQAKHLISQQISIEKKKKLGDYILDNSYNLDTLFKQIDTFLSNLCDN